MLIINKKNQIHGSHAVIACLMWHNSRIGKHSLFHAWIDHEIAQLPAF
jgi:hypothetical protein